MTLQSQGADTREARRELCPCGSGKNRKRCCGQTRKQPASSELIEVGLARHRSGLLQEAGEIYRHILHAEPEHPTALHFSGLIAHQRGQTEIALAFMTRSVQREPGNATFWVNLGQVFEANGDLDQAIAHYRKAVAIDPGMEAGHHGLGDALLHQGRLDEAAASYSRALAIKPNCPETVNSLGSLMQKAGKLERAVVCYQKAISLKPDYAEAYNNLGTALRILGKFDEAIEACRRALALKPAFSAAHSNLGCVLVSKGRFKEAAESLHKAIEIQPDLVEAHLNLGNAMRGQGLLSEAVRCYRHAITLAPDHADAYNNLAETYKDQGKLDEAVEAFQRALAAKPDFAAGYSNLLYLYAFTRHIPPEAERAQAEMWEKSVLSEEERAAARARTFAVRPRTGRQLRLGIVSAELGSHAVADFLEPYLDALDRSRFHLSLFPTSRRHCARAKHFQQLADNYISLVELSDAEAAARIRSEQIDVLMDTTGHTCGGRLGIFAHRAAPVQCTYIGYWGTTGLTEMDWFFSDPYSLPSADAHFTEGIWRLPRHAVCYKGDPSLPESRWVPDPAGTIWLGSFNKYCKIREETLGLWAKVLRAIPEAKLLLEDRASCEEETHARILTTLASHGVAQERVEFEPFISGHERHMALYDRLDVALDTIPFNSGTTASDALWMGVPLVALEGNWSGGRISSSALKAFGRPEWIAQDEEEYVSIVRSLGRDVELRKIIRGSQRARMAASELCDAKAMADALKDAFESMYDRWIEGARPGGAGRQG